MSLAAALAAEPVYKGTRPCTFKAWLNTRPPDEVAAVRAALAREQGDPLYWSAPALHRYLADKAGWTGSQSVIYKHRARDCMSCR